MSSASRSRAHSAHRQSKLSRRTRELSRRQMFFESLEGRSLLAGADAFASAPLIPNVATFSDTVDTTTFTVEPGEPLIGDLIPGIGINAQRSGWWKVQPTSSGIITVDTQGTNYPGSAGAGAFGAYGDTVMGVFTGAAVNALTAVAVNDDADGICCFGAPGYSGYSKITFAATAGQTYYITVNGFDTEGSGDFGPTQFNYRFDTTLYVDDSFAGFAPNQSIADADLGTTGNQPAVFGVNAFATINAALAASASNFTIVINGGTYGEAVSLAGTRTLKIGGPDAAQAVAINSVSAVAGTTINLAGTSTLSVGDASSTTISGLINGTGNLTKTGTGTLTLDNSNTYTGATTINAGVLRTGGHQAYQITTNTNANQFYGGSLGYDFTVGAGRSISVTQLGFYDANPTGLTNAHNVYISSNNGATVFATAVVPAGTVAPLVGGYRFVNLTTPVTLGPGTYRVWGDNYGVDGDYNSGGGAGPTDGGGSNELTFVGGSYFGNSNAFPTNADGGPAYRYGAASFNFTTQVLPAGTAVTIAAGATLDLANSNQTIGSLSGPVNSSVTMGAGSLTVNGSTSTTFGGSISGSGNLNKLGSSVLTLSGSNTYTGSTNVLGGTLKAGAPITTNLLAFYDFNDPNNPGLDRSGNNNTASLSGGAASVAGGNVGGALSLPGNGSLNLPNLSAMFAGQAATLSIWTKLNIGTPSNGTLTGFANFGSGSNDHYPWVDGTSYQNVFRNNSRVDSIALQPGIDRTQWHLVTIVSDPTDLATGWRMYQNGTLIKAVAPAFGIAGFQVGVQNGFFLNGFVDDVRLYNRALSTAEVQALYNSNAIPDNSPVVVSQGATFELGASETIGSLAGMGSVNLNSNRLYTGGNNTNTTYGGSIVGTGGVTKTGTGTLTLSGMNTYTGATNVDTGTLNLGATNVPPSFVNLYEWFDAADSSTMTQSGGTISQWRDKSGNNHNLNQGTAVNQPALVSGALNGNSVVRFDGNDVISSVATGNTPGTPYTVLSVARLEGSQNQRLITSNNNWLLGYWGGGMDQFYADGIVRLAGNNPFPDTALHFYGATGTGSLSTFFDGNRVIASNSGGLSSPNGISLGAWNGNPASEASKGDVAELLVFNGILTPSQLAEVYAYLQSKWLVAGTVLNDASAVNVASGANLNVNVADTVGNLSGAGTTTLNKTLTVNEAGTTTYSGTIQGAGGLTKTGAGTLTLSGAGSSYAGVTTVDAGTLVAASSAALGSSAGGTTVLSGAMLSLTGGITLGDAVSASGTGINGQGAIRSLSGTNTINGAISMLPDVAAVTLQNATAAASYSQATFSPKQMIDGLTTAGAGGWANFGNGNGSTAVFETAANLNPSGANTELTFSILSGGYTQHSIGRFKLYVTTDNRANFADGLDNGGQIGTNWTEIQIISAAATGGATLTVQPDNSILASGANPDPVTYTIKGLTNLANITGVRIETIKDASFVNAGPGRSGNGNYVIIEWGVTSADASTSNLTIGSDPASTLVLNGTITNPVSGTVSFVGAGNVSLGATGGITQTSGTTNVVDNLYGTLTNAGANNNFAGTLAINNGQYVAASNSAFGTTAAGTTVGIDGSLAFSGGITVGAEALSVTAVNGNVQDALINLSGTNTFGGAITVVPFTYTIGTSTGTITGGDAGDGVDLRGVFPYAVNTGGTPSGPVQGVTFTSTEGAGTPGLTWSSPNVIANYTAPNYGSSTNDDAFEAIMQSIRWNTGNVSFDFANMIVGHVYKVQLLFSDAYGVPTRRFNIVSEGATLATNFTSGSLTSNPVFTQIYTAADTTLNLLLQPGSTGDTNPIISGITIEDLGAAVTTHDLNIRSDSGTLNLNGSVGLNASVLTVKGAGNVTVGGSIGQTGASSLVKTGAGTLTLANANTYSGGTTISQGTVVVQNNNALDGGSVTLNDANTGANNTALLITNPTSAVITIPNNIVVANFGSGTTSIGSSLFNVGAFASVYSGTLQLNKATSLTGGNADRTTYTNVISGNVGTLTVTGGRRTTIEANNTFVGNVNVTTSGTTLQVGGQAANQIPDASNVDLAAGTFLTLNNDPEAINGLTGSGTVQNIVGGNLLTIGAGPGGTFVFSGAFADGSGPLSLTKTGTTIQYIDGASTYSGVTNINGGYLVVRNNAALGSTAGGTIVVNPGTLQLESGSGISIGAEPLTISGFGVGGTRGALASWSGTNSFAGNINIVGDASTFVQSGQLTLTGVISGSAAFSNRKIGAGDLVYAGGSTNTFAGTTILDQGNLYLGKTGGAFAISGPMQMGGGNTNQPNLRMQQANQFAPGVVMSLGAGQNPHARFDLQGFDQTLAGLVSPTQFLVVQNERLGGGGTTQAATLTLNGTGNYVFNGSYLRDEDDGGTTFKLNLVKTGSGTQALGGLNINYTGTTTVNDGVLQLVDTRNFRSPLAVNGTGVLDINSSTPFATRWNYGQAITGNGTIKKTGTGVFGIIGVNNFAGNILIQQGTIHNDNLTANWSGSTADVDISSGAFLDLRGNNITVDALTGTGSVINSYGNGTNTLTIGAANAVATFDGTISGSGSGAGGEGNGRTALSKIGTGVQTLTNANTYIAGTTIANGALIANNTTGSATGPGAVNVQTNGTLGGNGFIAGAVTANGKLDAGNVGAIGKLTINNNLTIAAGGALVAQLSDPTTPGTTYDQIVVTGDVNVTGATLSATHSSSAALGDLFTLIKNDGPNPTVGQFAGLAADPSHPLVSDQIATISGQRYYVTYNDPVPRFGTGNDVAVIRNRIVTAVNDNLGSILRNTAVTGNVRTNDIDADHDGIMTITSPVSHGTLTIDLVTGAFTYKPAIDYIGSDTFTYRLFDGEFQSFGVVTVDVTPAVVQGGSLYIAGSTAADRITIQPSTFGGNVSFRYNNTLFGPYDVTDRVIVFGLAGADNMTVTGNVDVPVSFYGGEGNDYLAGGNLNDILDGGSGVDRLLGGNGDDTLYGGADNDTLSGGNGNDLLDGDSYTDIPTVIAGGNLASLIGAILLPPAASQGKDTLGGDSGEDRLLGRGGDDTLNGGNDNDFLDGDVGNDKMDGGSGDDLMLGGAGGDTLYGRAGADVLVGGADVDTLYGATGADLMFGDNVSNPAALAAIMASWASSDYSGAASALKAIAVTDNAVDTLHGEGDADWYLMYINDKLKLATESKAPNVIVNLP